jgi:hypothetical protein
MQSYDALLCQTSGQTAVALTLQAACQRLSPFKK